MTDRFDALVLGGGPAGATTAIRLAREGLSVAVVEKKTFPRRKVCGEYLSATNLPLLQRLGMLDAYLVKAGPEIRRVALFGGNVISVANLPSLKSGAARWGRALSRDKLDSWLLDRAACEGASVLQPYSAIELSEDADGFVCRAECRSTQDLRELRARTVVAAHGSWESGTLPTQFRPPDSPRDLLGFKAHFRGARLPADLMPLIVFPGGYGGMATCEEGKVSLSCCIRRDTLAACRGDRTQPAGEVVLEHIARHCRGVRETLAAAAPQGSWLGAGPIRPGIRLRGDQGVFLVGNAAGEAHPVVAEGISMAMQGGWLAARHVLAWKAAGWRPEERRSALAAYHRAWRRAFAARIRVSSVVAHWAMRPAAVALLTPLLASFPRLLSYGAELSGKADRVVRCGSRKSGCS